MGDGVQFDRASADRIARAVQWVEQNQGGARNIPQRAHKNRARPPASESPIISVTHDTDANTILVTLNGWESGDARIIKTGVMDNTTLVLPDTFQGRFQVCIYMSKYAPNKPNNDIPPPLPSGFPPPPYFPPAQMNFELVQNGDVGGSHFMDRSALQIGAAYPDEDDVNEWYLGAVYESVLPIANVDISANSSSASVMDIAVSMLSRTEFLAHLVLLGRPRPYGWSSTPGSGAILTIQDGFWYRLDNSFREGFGGRSAAVTAGVILLADQPWVGYVMFAWLNAGHASPSLRAGMINISEDDFVGSAAEFGPGGIYNGYMLLRAVVVGNRVVDVSNNMPGALYPAARTPNEETDDGNDEVDFTNGIQTNITPRASDSPW